VFVQAFQNKSGGRLWAMDWTLRVDHRSGFQVTMEFEKGKIRVVKNACQRKGHDEVSEHGSLPVARGKVKRSG